MRERCCTQLFPMTCNRRGKMRSQVSAISPLRTNCQRELDLLQGTLVQSVYHFIRSNVEARRSRGYWKVLRTQSSLYSLYRPYLSPLYIQTPSWKKRMQGRGSRNVKKLSQRNKLTFDCLDVDNFKTELDWASSLPCTKITSRGSLTRKTQVVLQNFGN